MPYGSDPIVSPAPAGGYGKDPVVATAPAPAAKPEEGLSRFLPSFMKGPSVWEQLATEGSNMQEEKKRLGRDLTQSEIVHLALQNPIAMGFGTHQVGELPSGISKNIAAAGKNAIDTSVQSAIKPRAVVNPQEYQQKMRSAFNSVLNNKDKLQFTDPETGEQIKGQNPETVAQFRDAISQTKGAVFDRYNGMVKRGELLGLRIPLDNTIRELNGVATDPVTVELHPSEAKYAAKKIKRLQSLKDLSPSSVQQEIQKLNASLESFYGKRKKVGKATIDAMLANVLRNDLDAAISSAVEPGYQGLKNEYGALRHVERDVINRAQRIANQGTGDGVLGTIADIASAREVIHGLATGNVAHVATGAGIKGWKIFRKWRESPNRAIKNAFENAEKLRDAPTGPTPPVVPSAPISPFTLTQQPTALDQTLQQSDAP